MHTIVYIFIVNIDLKQFVLNILDSVIYKLGKLYV